MLKTRATIDTTNTMIDAQNKRYHKYNIQRVEAKPFFCEYISVDKASSTLSQGFKHTMSKIGKDSSIRYNKILDVPLYGFRTFNREINKTEYKGIKLDLDNQSIVLGKFEPCEGDFIIITMGKTKLLFEVTKVDPVNIVGDYQTKIDYKLKASYEKNTTIFEELEAQIISTSVYLVDNIGTDRVTIMNISDIDKLKRFGVAFVKMNNAYMNKFYDNINNVLICAHPTDPDIIIYSPLLVSFQEKAQCILFECSNNYSQALLLCHEIMGNNGYQDSMYADIVNDSRLISEFIYFDTSNFDIGGSYLRYTLEVAPSRTFSQLEQYKEASKFVYSLDYNDRIRSDSDPRLFILDSDSELIEIIKGLTSGNAMGVLQSIEKYRVNRMSVEDYLLIPIVLNLLKMIIEGLQKDPTYLSE